MTLVTPVRLRLPFAVLVAAVLAALGVLTTALPASAAGTRHVVHLTADGPVPSTLEIVVGDTVVFQNDEKAPVIPPVVPPSDGIERPWHQVVSATAPGSRSWTYDSKPLEPGDASAPTPAFSAAGTYSFTDTRRADTAGVPTGQTTRSTSTGDLEAVAPATTATTTPAGRAPADTGATSRAASAAPTRSPSASASASASPGPEASTAPDAASARNAPGGAPSPQPTGGTGVALRPDLGNQPLGLGGDPGAVGGPAPAVAPPAGEDPALLLSQGGTTQNAARSSLSEPDTGRRYGIPVVVALVALLGVTSLVVRVLLAEPLDRLTAAR